MRYVINRYRIGRGPGYQQSSALDVARQGTCGNFATAGLSENKRRKRGGKRVRGSGKCGKGDAHS